MSRSSTPTFCTAFQSIVKSLQTAVLYKSVIKSLQTTFPEDQKCNHNNLTGVVQLVVLLT